MKRIIVVSENSGINQNWLDKLKDLFPECQVKIQSPPLENKNPRKSQKTSRRKRAHTPKIRETIQ